MRCASAAVLALGLFATPVLYTAPADGSSAGLPAVCLVPASSRNSYQQLFGARTAAPPAHRSWAKAAIMLARYQGKVVALSMVGPHQKAAVKWLPKEQRFQCTKHDSKYQPSGIYMSGRATRNLDRFPIRLDGSSIVVDVTKVYKSDQDAAGWTCAMVAV